MSETIKPRDMEPIGQRPTAEQIKEAALRIIEKGPDAFSLANDINSLAKGDHPDAERFENIYPGWTQEDFKLMDEELERELGKE